MSRKPFNPFAGSGLGAVPKGWIAVADVYARIAIDFLNQLGQSLAVEAPMTLLAGKPPDRHDAHAVPYFLTWRVLSYCRKVGLLEPDGSVRVLRDKSVLRAQDEWCSTNEHMALARGRLGSGADNSGRPLTQSDLAKLGYSHVQPILVRQADVNRGRSEVFYDKSARGRPEIGKQAASTYLVRFPEGHKAEMLTTSQAAEEVSRVLGKEVSWKTIKRHLPPEQ